MASWLLVIILAYFFFGLASLGDKLVLSGRPKPRSYTFYAGFLGIFLVFVLPFINFGWPRGESVIWIALDAIAQIAGLYAMFMALERFEVSKVIATIGATQPIFIFGFTWIFWGSQVMPATDIAAFILLFLGSVIISAQRTWKITGDYLKLTLFSSLMFSLDYIFSKMVYMNEPFLQGIIWIRFFILAFVLVFLISKKSRKEIFSKRVILDRKTQLVFAGTQACGAAANFLQGFAISLAPVAFLATINSLRGIQYVFLFIMTLLVSVFLPQVLQEKITKKVVLQKLISIMLITIGLLILTSKPY